MNMQISQFAHLCSTTSKLRFDVGFALSPVTIIHFDI